MSEEFPSTDGTVEVGLRALSRQNQAAYLATLQEHGALELVESGLIGKLWRGHTPPEKWRYVARDQPAVKAVGPQAEGKSRALFVLGQVVDGSEQPLLFLVGFQLGKRYVADGDDLSREDVVLVARQLDNLREDPMLPDLDADGYAIVPEGRGPTVLRTIVVPPASLVIRR